MERKAAELPFCRQDTIHVNVCKPFYILRIHFGNNKRLEIAVAAMDGFGNVV